MKHKNPQDTTLRNTRAATRRLTRIEGHLRQMRRQIEILLERTRKPRPPAVPR